jgi:hypothetical protein
MAPGGGGLLLIGADEDGVTTAPGSPQQQQTSLRQIVNCAARNSSTFTISFVLGVQDNAVADFFLGSSFVSPLIVALTNSTPGTSAGALKAGAEDIAQRAIRPVTAAFAGSRVGPNIQSLNTNVTGPRFGSTPVGRALVGTVSKITRFFAKAPTLPWEGLTFFLSLALCAS